MRGATGIGQDENNFTSYGTAVSDKTGGRAGIY